jgi:hypothetical protein
MEPAGSGATWTGSPQGEHRGHANQKLSMKQQVGMANTKGTDVMLSRRSLQRLVRRLRGMLSTANIVRTVEYEGTDEQQQCDQI